AAFRECLLVHGFPMVRPLPEGLLVNGPVVQDRRLEVSAVGPNQRVDFRIERYLVEDRESTQRPIQLSRQHRQEVYRAIRSVSEANSKHIVADDLKSGYPMNCVLHVSILAVQSAAVSCLLAAYSSPQSIRLGAIPPKLQPSDVAAAATRLQSARQVQC